MPVVKKLIFAPLCIVLVLTLLFFYKPFLEKYLNIFLAEYGGVFEFGLLALIISITGISYCLYLAFTQNIKYSLIFAFIASITPFLFFPPSLALVIGIGMFASFLVVHFTLQSNLKTYVNFQPTALLSGPVKTFNSLLLLSLAFGFFLNTNSIIKSQGFSIPEEVIEWATDLSIKQSGIEVKGEKYLAQSLTPEQLELLQQNPEVLEQFGVSIDDVNQFVQDDGIEKNQEAVKIVPSVKDNFSIKDKVKAQIRNTLEEMIKPYLFAIPFILAFLFYSISGFYLWLISLLINPLIILLFYIFEKSGFIKYQKEVREIKKMVI
jgi:ABC-type multidrug transport system fused ATPase/permease subunit